MRTGSHVLGATVPLAVLLAALVGGCSGGSPRVARTPSPADDGLNTSDCVAPQNASAGGGSWQEVACEDPAAVAEVIQVDGVGGGVAGAMAEPDCPEGTDHALRGTDFGLLQQKVTWSFVCARNLKPPHPGDPGEGGGPGIVEGDCVRVTEGLANVEEVPCDGQPKATHRVTIIIQAICPPGNDASFAIGRAQFGDPLSQKVACAEKL
ncbi:hypothetical protein [Actinoplanes derwentensis]|uniref:Uncharacterized protein n=1 Tax=Actinoplanes derwentensis TaxID=113562 RepID=A0A1H1T795_9ACTN|nr:hypothetical protein [Actinoplanes derwentensis]GID88989.1 hypothetical protein Ade03nite_79130 [Actinoplanes derwentensis]SDS55519.1 hypothetical protein SAMN04489716_1043 [Actinoplanes derwentensis]